MIIVDDYSKKMSALIELCTDQETLPPKIT